MDNHNEIPIEESGLSLEEYLDKAIRRKWLIIIPFILTFGLLGSFLTHSNFADILMTLSMGALGYAMKVYDYPRAPLILGIVLGEIAENALHLSLNLYGPAFLLRPITLLLIAITVGSVIIHLFGRIGNQ